MFLEIGRREGGFDPRAEAERYMPNTEKLGGALLQFNEQLNRADVLDDDSVRELQALVEQAKAANEVEGEQMEARLIDRINQAVAVKPQTIGETTVLEPRADNVRQFPVAEQASDSHEQIAA